MRTSLHLILSRVLRSLWFRPALYAALAVAVLALAPFIAHLLPSGLMKLIGLSGVYDLLGALASTLLAVATFSLGIMASSLRAASSAASPRVRPLLAQDTTARNAISTFIGGFVFAVMGIVGLSTGYYSDASKVLLFFVTCALILALIVALIRWIGRLSRLGDVTEAIDLVEEASRKALLDLAAAPFFHGVPLGKVPPTARPLDPVEPGFVQAVDVQSLAGWSEKGACDLYVLARPGAFVGPGQPLLAASHPLSDEDRRCLRDAFVVGRQRTFEADPRFGLIVLSEIGSKALSPGINDPGTAIDVIATAVRLLCEWSEAADLSRPEVRHPRLHVSPVSPDEFLADALRPVARDGAGLVEVQIWIQKALAMLATKDPQRFGVPARALSLEAQARAETALELPADRVRLRAELALSPLT
jgi:uncharacterized membrane protein